MSAPASMEGMTPAPGDVGVDLGGRRIIKKKNING
jgi:hypothetical protein